MPDENAQALVRKRWAKASAKERHDEGQRLLQTREHPATPPRLQDTRTAQVLGNTDLGATVSQTVDIWERVNQRMKDAAPTAMYWNRKFQEYAATLEEIAKDFHASGQPEKATQVFMVLLKYTKDLGKPEEPPKAVDDSAEDTANRIDFTAMSDEQLKELAAKRNRQDS